MKKKRRKNTNKQAHLSAYGLFYNQLPDR